MLQYPMTPVFHGRALLFLFQILSNKNNSQTTSASHSAAHVHGASSAVTGSGTAAKERPDELNIKQLARVGEREIGRRIKEMHFDQQFFGILAMITFIVQVRSIIYLYSF